MIYAKTGSFVLSVSVKLSIVEYWLKVINSGDNPLIRIAYEGMRRDTACAKCDNVNFEEVMPCKLKQF